MKQSATRHSSDEKTKTSRSDHVLSDASLIALKGIANTAESLCPPLKVAAEFVLLIAESVNVRTRSPMPRVLVRFVLSSFIDGFRQGFRRNREEWIALVQLLAEEILEIEDASNGADESLHTDLITLER